MIFDPASGLYGALVCGALLVVLLRVSIKSREYWPFSCYPMFSVKMDQSHLEIFRVALDQGDKGTCWWNPEFHRLPRAYGKAFRQSLDAQGERADENDLTDEQRALFIQIASDLSDAERRDTVALVLIGRRLTQGDTGADDIHETPLLRFATQPAQMPR